MDKLEVLIGWIGTMAWMCKGMEIDMRVKVDMMKVDMMEDGMRLMVWICRMLKVDMMRVDMMKVDRRLMVWIYKMFVDKMEVG